MKRRLKLTQSLRSVKKLRLNPEPLVPENPIINVSFAALEVRRVDFIGYLHHI